MLSAYHRRILTHRALVSFRAIHEVPSGYTLAGGAIIVAAITYQALSGARRPRPLPMA